MTMKKKSPSSFLIARRAWRLLRLTLLWAKKGKAFRNKLLLDLRPLPKYLKTLRRTASHSHRLYYNERQFSFDDSPAFHFKKHCPASMRQLHIPCFNASAVDFDDGDSGRISLGIEEKVCSSDTCEKHRRQKPSQNSSKIGLYYEWHNSWLRLNFETNLLFMDKFKKSSTFYLLIPRSRNASNYPKNSLQDKVSRNPNQFETITTLRCYG